MNFFKKASLLLVGVFAPMAAFAQEAASATTAFHDFGAAIGAGLAIGVAAAGCGMGQGRAVAAALEGIA
ncbi:MAG: hypothetical protein QNL04_05145, partial [SAR324 cluster bacterium]|nr:hypothetical protein [SAR324 cluster bacterium]